MNKLSKNYTKIFWIEALFYVNFVNLVSTLLYIERGLTISHAFWLAIVYSLTNIITEIPSSYMADYWGRKKTIVFGAIALVFSYTVSIFAQDLLAFAFATALYAVSIAAISGTSEALLYDTNIELGNQSNNFDKLSKYHSAKHFLKIFATIMTGFLAINLTESEFILIYALNALVAFAVVIISLTLKEPKHSKDISKMEKGIFLDSITLLRSQKLLRTAMFNKTLIFISHLIIFIVFQKIFVDLGLTLAMVGIFWSIGHFFRFILKRYLAHIFTKPTYGIYINNINYIITALFLLCILMVQFYPNGYLLLSVVVVITVLGSILVPLFSHYYNHISNSYNRATTLSMTNLLKNFLDIPVMLFVAYVVTIDQQYIFTVSFFLCLIVIIFFKVPKLTVIEQK